MNVAARDVKGIRRVKVKTQPPIFMWWLCISLFFEYARPANFVPGLGALPLNSLLPLSLFVVSLVHGSMRPFGEIFGDRSARWITFYITLIGLSVFTSDVNFTSYKVFELSLGYFFIFIMIARIVRTEAHIMALVFTLAIAHAFLLAMNPVVLTDPTTRNYIVGGTFLGDGNDFSLSICLLLPLIMELALRQKTLIPRAFCWGVVALLLLAVIASQSRGAAMGLGAVFLYMWYCSSNKAAGVAAAIVLAIAVAIYAPSAYYERIGTISQYETEGSAQARISAWKAGGRMILDKPLTGVSAGMFPVAYGTKYKPRGENVHWANAHSIYFLVIGELGVPGILTLIALIVGSIRANIRMRERFVRHLGTRLDPAQEATARLLVMASAAMIGFAVAGAFLSAAYYPHIYVLTGTLVVLRCILRGSLPPETPTRARRAAANARKASAAPPANQA
jgi:probable O-glycosylation ligase (exosortase A-associated)